MPTPPADAERTAVDIANCKMLMMLSQTFYTVGKEKRLSGIPDASGETVAPQTDDRSRRAYIKSRIMSHRMWSDDSFWDQALFQCVSEALHLSKVMPNLCQQAAVQRYGGGNAVTLVKDMKWHDLLPQQRDMATTQVHDIVAAQLGALAHSMIEFNCGLEKAERFVRRLSVRYQLPMETRRLLLEHVNGAKKNRSKSLK